MLCTFNANMATQFKVSKTPLLNGWNSTMTIMKILDQLQDSYGRPNTMTLFKNHTLFHSPMTPGDSLEMPFYRIKQCQEIQRIEKVPYSDDQIITTAVRILITSNMFLLKEFDTWESTVNKTYLALKTFFHKAYGRHLMALELWSTSGQNGYTSSLTIFNVMEGDDNTNNNTVATITQTAAATAAGTTGTAPSTSGVTSNSYNLAINADIVAAISQLLAK
jgi:hypothetical protein